MNERWLRVKAIALVALAVVAIRCFRLQLLQRLFVSRLRSTARSYGGHQIARAVAVACSCVPGANCLSAALAGVHLLTASGHTAELRIGVAKDENRRLRSHAWVECDGEVLIGGDRCEDFVPLTIPEVSGPS